MKYSALILEEELKNKLRKDFFEKYDSTQILKNIDFAIADKDVLEDSLFELENQYYLWAEAKRGGKKDIHESFVQLILTIGKEKTNQTHIPPAFLGAFDSEKIAFLQYYKIAHIFSKTDFNWNVRPSDHDTKEFKELYTLTEKTLEKESLIFSFEKDESELKEFIKKNFTYKTGNIRQIEITKNNFISIYQKWLQIVKPTINVNWDVAKRNRIIEADFYLADLLSMAKDSLKENLYVVLQEKGYELRVGFDEMGLFTTKKITFNDNQKAYNAIILSEN